MLYLYNIGQTELCKILKFVLKSFLVNGLEKTKNLLVFWFFLSV